jgi:competence protein ComEC
MSVGLAMAVRRAPRPRPLALAALALVAGIVAGLDGSLPHLVLGGALAALLTGLAALLLNARPLVVVAAAVAIATGGAISGAMEKQRAERDCRLAWKSGESVAVTGLALGYLPAGERGSVRVRPSSAPSGRPCVWAAELRLWADGPLQPGGVYRVRGEWQLAASPGRGPRPLDRLGWVAATGIRRLAAPSARRHPLLAARAALAERLWRVYPRRWAPLALALVLGHRETMDPEDTQSLARAGIIHLLAISGLHVGILAVAAFALARLVRLSPTHARVATVVLTSAYVLLVGAPASAVRAGLMVLLWTLARLAGRTSSAFDVLGLSAVVLLVARPWSVVDAGFQLSYAGTAALAYVHGEARRWPRPRGPARALRAVAASMLLSAATVLLTAPITAAHFGRVAPAAVVGNLVAIPLFSITMPALFLSAALAHWPALAAWPAAASVVVLWALVALAQLLNATPWGSLEVTRPGLVPAAAYVALLVLAAQALHGAWHRRRLVLALGVFCAAALTWPTLRYALPTDRLTVYVLDVGQGDAIAIRTPRGHWLLVDAGPRIEGFDAGRQRVVPFLREQGARRLEAFIASHPDLDHVGGFPAVHAALDVQRVIGVGRVTGQVGQVALLEALAGRPDVWFRATAGARLSLDGVELSFAYPPATLSGDAALAPNLLSLVFQLRFGQFRMLFTGDVLGSVEDSLARADSSAVRVDVLKVAHHGSATSTSSRFLDVARPQLAVISAGRGNVYGHPSPQVLWRLAAHGVPARRTDRDGTVVIEAERGGAWRVSSAAEGF